MRRTNVKVLGDAHDNGRVSFHNVDLLSAIASFMSPGMALVHLFVEVGPIGAAHIRQEYLTDNDAFVCVLRRLTNEIKGGFGSYSKYQGTIKGHTARLIFADGSAVVRGGPQPRRQDRPDPEGTRSDRLLSPFPTSRVLEAGLVGRRDLVLPVPGGSRLCIVPEERPRWVVVFLGSD